MCSSGLRKLAACCAPKQEFETEFSSELLCLFSPPSEPTKSSKPKKSDSIVGWETCEELHEADLHFQCVASRPYLTLRLMHLSLNDSEELAAEMMSRPKSVNSETKRRNKAASCLNVSIRRSKSSRCLQSGPPPSLMRTWVPSFQPGFRYDSRFPIKYDFQPFRHHQQHTDAYRNSHTYTLIRNFRELKATGGLPHKWQADWRTKVSAEASGAKESDKQPRDHGRCTPQWKKRGCKTLDQSSVVYYTDQCQTGPVVNLRGTRVGDVISSAAVASSGTWFVPKSTMEINAVTLRSSQQKSFGEREAQSKLLEQPALKGSKPKGTTEDLFGGKKKTNARHVGIVAGTSALGRSSASVAASRRASPLGKVAVAIRRSSPSIRGKRDPVSGTKVNRFLSIAADTHTVASPYHTVALQSQEDLYIDGE